MSIPKSEIIKELPLEDAYKFACRVAWGIFSARMPKRLVEWGYLNWEQVNEFVRRWSEYDGPREANPYAKMFNIYTPQPPGEEDATVAMSIILSTNLALGYFGKAEVKEASATLCTAQWSECLRLKLAQEANIADPTGKDGVNEVSGCTEYMNGISKGVNQKLNAVFEKAMCRDGTGHCFLRVIREKE